MICDLFSSCSCSLCGLILYYFFSLDFHYVCFLRSQSPGVPNLVRGPRLQSTSIFCLTSVLPTCLLTITARVAFEKVTPPVPATVSLIHEWLFCSSLYILNINLLMIFLSIFKKYTLIGEPMSPDQLDIKPVQSPFPFAFAIFIFSTFT